jgi:aspartate aminotransferase
MAYISSRIGKIKPSPTLAVTAKAEELKRAGKKIISLGVGEPDFDTPDNIKQAAIDAIKSGKTKYTSVDGIIELKTAIVSKLKRENNLEYDTSQITVGTGGKQVIYNLFMASLNAGDEVIIPAPFWVSYPDIVALAEGVPVIVECPIQNGFKLTPLQLSNAITKKTKWLILNSPSNPTGSAYTKAELAALAEVLKQNPHVHVMTDDIYEHIIFEDFLFFNIINACQELQSRCFIVNGVSKSYSMTGWRIGYGAGDKELIKAINIIQSQSTSNPSSISQYAALEALNGTQDFMKPNAIMFEEKRDLVLDVLNSTVGIECHKPEGAFYVFPSCHRLMNKSTPDGKIISNSNDFAEYLLSSAEVAVVPGVAFGMENHFRISTAASKEVLKEACIRIKKACEALKSNP